MMETDSITVSGTGQKEKKKRKKKASKKCQNCAAICREHRPSLCIAAHVNVHLLLIGGVLVKFSGSQ